MSQNPEQKSEKSLQKENKSLRAEARRIEQKIKTIEADLSKSNSVKDRLEELCRELQKQNKFTKAESSAKLQEASEKGQELFQEVHQNMGFMQNINDNLTSITNDSLEIQKENEELSQKIAILRRHYDERENILQSALKETNDALTETQTEITELNIKSVEDKQKLYQEMQQLASALVKSGEEMKEAKQIEAQLRELLQSYEKKFEGLQTALTETNAAYETFRSEMGKVNLRTKELDQESSKWQKRWEESTASLQKIEQNNAKLEGELLKARESLTKMTELCRTLQVERKNMLNEIKGSGKEGKENKNDKPKPTAKPVSKK